MVVVGGRCGPDVLEPVSGIPMLVRSVQVLLASGLVQRVQVLGTGERRDAVVEVCRGLPVDVRDSASVPVRAHAAQRADHPAGDGPGTRMVVVHDARRPLAPPALAEAVLEAVRGGHPAAVPVIPLADTVKLVDGDGLLRGAADRSGLRVVQTPQAFRAGLLPVDLDPLDAATVLAASGVAVHTVAGDPLAFPVRTAWDLQLARLLAARR